MRSRLTPLDGSFLRLETPNAHMHVAWSGLFEPHPDLPRPTVEALREKVAARLDRVPRFRQRLAFPPMRLAEPSWVDDAGFAVENHVTALGDPGAALTLRRFGQLTDSALSEPLDRAHPLWQVQLVPCLEDGRAGLIFKMHHALVDGRSAVELALLLFDLTPDPGPEPPSPWTPAPPPSAARLALDAFYSNTLEPLRAARGVGRLAARPGEVGFTGTLRRAALAFEQDLLRSAPDSYLNTPIGPRRVLVRHRARMSDVVDAKRRAGATVNDVCLAAVAGALRELALLRGETPSAAEGDGARLCARRRPAPGPRQPHHVRVRRAPGRNALTRRQAGAGAPRDRVLQAVRPRGGHRCDAGSARPAAGPGEEPRRAARIELARLQPDGLQHPGPAVPALHARGRAERGISGGPDRRAALARDRDVQLPGPHVLRPVRRPGGAARGARSCPSCWSREIVALARPRRRKRRRRTTHLRVAPTPATAS